jgi:outer membrane protein assembly factor BamB
MTRIVIFSLLVMMLSCSEQLPEQKNSQWRGKNRDGVYNETGLLKEWTTEPELVWSYEGLGLGYTTVAIANSKIYVTGMSDSSGILYVLDLQGKLLNKKPYGFEWNTNFHGTRSTVNVNDGKLYIFTGRGVLLCLDEKTLETVWSKDLLNDFDGTNLKFGMTESPLIVGDIVYATPGGQKNNIVAMNKNTGALIWSSEGIGRTSNYCSPQYVGDQEIPSIVTAMDSCVISLNAKTGELLWTVDQKNPYGMNPNTPIYANGMIFSTTGGGIGSMLLRIINGGKGVEKVWSNEMDNKMGGAVKVGDYVYGSGEKNKYWYCIDWKTGETKYKENKIGSGDVIAADGMLYCYSDRGEMALVKATPENFDLKGMFKVTLGTEQHWAHPVINDGILYIRHGDALMAYNVKL